MNILLDRRLTDDSSGVSVAYAGGNTTWTLPYAVAVDGSQGEVQVVRTAAIPETEILVSDSFVDTVAVLLENHTPTGSPTDFDWVIYDIIAPGSLGNVTIKSGGGASANSGANGLYYSTYVPPTADYSVIATGVFDGSSNFVEFGVRGRVDIATKQGYTARLRADGRTFLTVTDAAGASVFITFPNITPFTTIGTHTLELRCTGTLVEVIVDGVTIISHIDATITLPGHAAAQFGGVTGNKMLTWRIQRTNANASDDVYEVLTTTRPTTTTVRAVGDYLTVPVTMGVAYDMELTLSKLHLRNVNRAGEEVAETGGRTQVRRLRIHTEDTKVLNVAVTNEGRAAVEYAFVEDDLTDSIYSVPVLARNIASEIVLSNDAPFPTQIVALDWEGFYETKARRM